MLIAAAVACLLSGCSGGGDAATESAPRGRRPSTVEGDTGSPAAESVVAERAVADTAGHVPADLSEREPSQAAPDRGGASETSGGRPSIVETERPSAAEHAAPEPAHEQTAGLSARGLRVVRAYVCRGIERSEPTEAGKSFVPEDGVLTLCCFSEVVGAAEPDTVFHVWRWGDREMARVALEVKGARWRTWSTKRILDEWRGEWHVDIEDRDRVVLTTLDFSVE